MGPFKHTVDDGLDIRKAAFECMYTLLDSCLDRLDIFEFLNHVEDGLKDHYDIKVSCYFSLCKPGLGENTLNSEYERGSPLPLLHLGEATYGILLTSGSLGSKGAGNSLKESNTKPQR